MSFVRFSEHSDLYIYSHYLGYIECCGCSIYETFEAYNLEDLLAHVAEHRNAGHTVPEGLEEKLKEQVTLDDFKPSESNPVEMVKQPWFYDLVEAMKDKSPEEINKILDSGYFLPEDESEVEQAVRLARENQLNLFIKAILANHSKACYGEDGVKKCTHEEDVETIKDTQ